MNIAAILLFALVGLPIMLMWQGFVFKTMWAWFVVPTFALAPLTLAYAIGISAIVRLLTLNIKPKDDSPDLLKAFMTGIMGYGLFLLVGWIVTWFI